MIMPCFCRVASFPVTLHRGYFPSAAVVHESDESRLPAVLVLAHDHGLAFALQGEGDEARSHRAPLLARHPLEQLLEPGLHVQGEAVEHRRGIAVLPRGQESLPGLLRAGIARIGHRRGAVDAAAAEEGLRGRYDEG